MKARISLATAIFAAMAIAGSIVAIEGQAAKAKPRPNVVVIETDDQTLEEMRVMRNTLALLGRQGTTFDNSFVTLSLCCPSRATFLTGQYAHNNGVLTNSMPNGGYDKLDHTNTLAVWLQNAGYNTALVGKYLNGYKLADGIPPGWTEWHAGLNLSFFNWTMNEQGTVVQYGSQPQDYQTSVLTQKAVEVINRRVPESKPLFMWVTYHAPHSGGPKEPDDPRGIGTVNTGPYRDTFKNEPLPNMPSFNEPDVSDKPLGIRNRPVLTPQRTAAIREAYQQQLESLLSVDDGVKAIVDALRARGELGNTLVVFTDDNGFFHGQHRVPSGKVLLYEPSIRVPLLMRGPGVPKNRHLKQMVANIDLAPTIVDAANAKAGRVMDGKSLLPLLAHPSRQWGRDLLIERGPTGAQRAGTAVGEIGNGDDGNQGKTAAPGDRQFVGVRTPKFLYAEYANGEKELYDLANDPDELNNVAGQPEYAALQAELAGRLAKLESCAGAPCKVGPAVSLTRTNCKFRVSGADARFVSSTSFARNGRTVTARISFADGRVVLRSGTLPKRC